MKFLFPAVLSLFMTVSAWAQPKSLNDNLLNAIRMVESSGDDTLVGDGGEAIGPFQIHENYWKDAVEHDPSIGGAYEDCFDRDYAVKVVKAYMKRYAPKNATAEEIARLHNGGCNVLKKSKTSKAWKNTTAYWNKVKKNLK